MGPQGPAGSIGATGPQGPIGPTGPQGIPGPDGTTATNAYANFYAVNTEDNQDAIPPEGIIEFPQNGPIGNTDITRLTDGTFELATVGAYLVSFIVNVANASQIALSLNGTVLDYTATEFSTGNTQIVGTVIVQTTAPDSVLSVINYNDNNLMMDNNQTGNSQLVIIRLA
jgi:hypothetical protein